MRCLVQFGRDHPALLISDFEACCELAGTSATYNTTEASRVSALDRCEHTQTFDHLLSHRLHADKLLVKRGDRGEDVAEALGDNERLLRDITCFLEADFASEEAARSAVARSVSVMRVYELWAVGDRIDDALVERANAFYQASVLGRSMQRGDTFSFQIDGFGVHISQQEYPSRLRDFSALHVWTDCKVQLKQPQHRLWILEDHGIPAVRGPRPIRRVYVARELGSGLRHLHNEFMLSKRAYIGSTSMDAMLSFYMCNQARVQPGHVVWDPFVGTGSVLVSAAKFGAFCIGSDVNARPLRGRENGSNMKDNFAQYGLPRAALYSLLMLNVKAQHVPMRQCELIDAIVCDPPYGLRESVHTVRLKTTVVNETGEELQYRLRDRFHFAELVGDLVLLCARVVRRGGFLVFWMPTGVEFDADACVPQIAGCVELRSVGEQPLQTILSRRLITMQKVGVFTEQTPLEGLHAGIERLRACHDELKRVTKSDHFGDIEYMRAMEEEKQTR